MAKKRKRPPQEEPKVVEFDMTPMIDVTFQLIVFFLVANDLSKKETVDLELPQALHGAEDKGTEKHRVIINLKKPKGDPNNPEKVPVVTVKGKEMTRDELRNFLVGMAGLEREPDDTGKVTSASPSAVYVLVRADRDAPWQHVQFVMQVLADQKIAMYKMQFATTKNADGKPSAAGQ